MDFERLDILIFSGQRLVKLIHEWLPVGSDEIIFNATNMARGLYLYQLKTDNFFDLKKCLLIK